MDKRAAGICFNERPTSIKRKTRNRAGAIRPDSREPLEFGNTRGKRAPIRGGNNFCRFFEKPRAAIISDSLPHAQNLCKRRARGPPPIRKYLHPLVIFRKNAGDLRLLKHYFRNKNPIGVLGFPPRKRAASMLLI